MPTDPNSIAAIPPGVDPTEWLKVQRQMSLAQALQGMSMSPVQNELQQPAGGGKYYQAARVGPISALSKLAEAMMANRGFKKAMPAMAEQMSQGMQAFQPGGQMVPTGQSALVEGAQGAPEGPVHAPSTPTYTQAPPNPLNPQGLPPAVMMRLYQSDPAKYATMLQGTTEYQNALRAAGGDPQQAIALMHAQAVKSGTVEARPGAWVQGPNGKWVQLPQGGPGQHLSFDAQGNLVASRIPGYIETAADLAGKEEASKQANIPRLIPLGGGKERYGYPQDIIGAAPANRAPPSNSPTAPQYLPKAPQTPALPQAPPSARNAPPQGEGPQGMWATVPKLPIPNTPGQTTDVYHEGILKEAVTKRKELADKYGSDAALADARIAFNKEALAVLDKAETGPISDELVKLSAKAQELGIKVPWLPDAETIKNSQELKKFLLRNPLLNLKPTFGRPAASEFQVLKEEASPNPLMMKSAIRRLVGLDSQQAEYTKQQEADFGTYTEKGGDPMRFEGWYSRKRPLADFFAQKATPPTAIDRVQKNPALLPDFKAKYGWDPTQ